jgi:anthranilate phosphoribosyltransferase
MAIQTELRRISEERGTLSVAEAASLMRGILAGEASDLELAHLLGTLTGRGETAAEVAGFALALREAGQTLPLTDTEREELVDTCGTGGDSSGTFNISTAAALVAAAAGATVAKHGNRKVTSTCGSADVLEALGIPIHLEGEAAASALRRHKFCFLLAPSHHKSMLAMLPVRRAIRVRSVLHVLGPLLNPAGARRQVMGVYQSRLVPLVADAMTMLDVSHAFVVHGNNGLDELALDGESEVAEVRGGKVERRMMTPEDVGLARAPVAALQGSDAAANAAILTSVFAGERGPRRDIVLLNAAAVLVAAGVADELRAGVDDAARAIDTGLVTKLVSQLSS